MTWVSEAIAVGAAIAERGGSGVGHRRARRRDLDRDLAAAGDGAGHRALGLDVEHADNVAFGAVVERLAARGEVKAGGLEDHGDGLVALHQIGLDEIGGAQGLAGADRTARLHADRLLARGRIAADLAARTAFDRRRRRI